MRIVSFHTLALVLVLNVRASKVAKFGGGRPAVYNIQYTIPAYYIILSWKRGAGVVCVFVCG